jgi:hypothetical protein
LERLQRRDTASGSTLRAEQSKEIANAPTEISCVENRTFHAFVVSCQQLRGQACTPDSAPTPNTVRKAGE